MGKQISRCFPRFEFCNERRIIVPPDELGSEKIDNCRHISAHIHFSFLEIILILCVDARNVSGKNKKLQKIKDVGSNLTSCGRAKFLSDLFARRINHIRV